MTRYLPISVSAAILVAVASTPGHALTKCPEGKTSSGTCVNAQLSQDLRKRMIVYTQPKISKTAPIYLPRQDRDFLLPRDLIEQFIPIAF